MPEAKEDLLALRAHERKKVLDGIEIHLRYEPEKVSKSRIKRLVDLESHNIAYGLMSFGHFMMWSTA